MAKEQPLSKLAEPLTIYPQVLENIRVTDKTAAQNDPDVQKAVRSVAEALAAPAASWCGSPARSRWCGSWWKPLTTIPARSTSARWWRPSRARGMASKVPGIVDPARK